MNRPAAHPPLLKLNFVPELSSSAQLNNALSPLTATVLLSKSSLKRSHFNEHEICHPAKSSQYASFILIRLREFQKFCWSLLVRQLALASKLTGSFKCAMIRSLVMQLDLKLRSCPALPCSKRERYHSPFRVPDNSLGDYPL